MARRRSGKRVAPPSDLKGAARERWRAVIADLAGRGPVDVTALATYCRVWARWQEAEAKIATTGVLIRTQNRASANPLIAISNSAAAQAHRLELQLGIGAPSKAASPTEDTPPEGPLVTRRQLSDLLDVHMMTVTKWERDGLPIARRGRKGKPSLYRLSDVRAWTAARESSSANAGVDVAKERAQKEHWQSRLAEQAFKVRSRELLARSEVEKVWAAEIAAVRTVLLAAPVTHADRIHRAAVTEGVAGVERELKAVVVAALRELANPDRVVEGAPAPDPEPSSGEAA